MAGSTIVVVSNHFEALAVKLRSEAEHLVAETANRIEASMQAGSSARIGRTIRTRRRNAGLTVEITAGDRRAIHAGFVEFGTVHRAASPFATPAAEKERHQFEAAARDLLKRGL